MPFGLYEYQQKLFSKNFNNDPQYLKKYRTVIEEAGIDYDCAVEFFLTMNAEAVGAVENNDMVMFKRIKIPESVVWTAQRSELRMTAIIQLTIKDHDSWIRASQKKLPTPYITRSILKYRSSNLTLSVDNYIEPFTQTKLEELNLSEVMIIKNIVVNRLLFANVIISKLSEGLRFSTLPCQTEMKNG
ncbi:1456_t:CDS:2 [Funneliformis caledonium]|uniref:1456_t:CDS:1 n=1 Tax=Funneliformis caledonium TaxID=1117310 RepID=A0A9N9ETR4_9GLOM|nr:1456_t:CDS:2 [Funneliformis caledonium]